MWCMGIFAPTLPVHRVGYCWCSKFLNLIWLQCCDEAKNGNFASNLPCTSKLVRRKDKWLGHIGKVYSTSNQKVWGEGSTWLVVVFIVCGRLQHHSCCWSATREVFLTAVSRNSVLEWNLLSPQLCGKILITGWVAVDWPTCRTTRIHHIWPIRGSDSCSI